MSEAVKPTRREKRRVQTVQEIKQLAMEQIREGGPDAVSLSGIVRAMSMSPAAVYRYFANRDALLADLVVDAYNELADSLDAIGAPNDSPEMHLDAVLRGTREWALKHPNAYRLIFQTSSGSGQDLAVERTVPAASRSMSVIIDALATVGTNNDSTSTNPPEPNVALSETMRTWAERSGNSTVSGQVVLLAFLTWTRLHGIISLELGGHLDATGVGASVLFDAEVETIRSEAARLRSA